MTYDSASDERFIFHKHDRSTQKLQRSERGIFYLDTNCDHNDKEIENVSFVETVAVDKNNYTNSDYYRATAARKLQNTASRPSLRNFVDIEDDK